MAVLEGQREASAMADRLVQVASRLHLPLATAGLTVRSVHPLRLLGHGRAAQAWLVQAATAAGEQLLAVEKVFQPAWLTRLIYRVAFQAPFGYQTNEHAILASLYRRRVAGALVRATVPGVRVAEPLYVRWDAEAEAFVLGSEFIGGRGIVPQAADRYTLRRWIARPFGRDSRYPARPPEEIRELLGVMTALERLFRDSGLVGSGWQVCKRAMVSTANLLRTSNGYVVVDLESGIPAMLVPYYAWAGVRLGALPLFDDIDPRRLHNWLDVHRSELVQQLGSTGFTALCGDADRLIEHTRAWKLSELALGRNKWRVFGPPYREQFKAACLARWERRQIIDDETAAAIRPGRRIFSRMIFLLGLVPGAAGRLLQRLWANRGYRDRARRFVRDAEYRRSQLADFVQRRSQRWRDAGRIAPGRQFVGFDLRFVVNAVLARCTPAALHRWFADPIRRRNVLVRMFLICVSGRFQSEYGRHLIRAMIRQWSGAQRLSPAEEKTLRRQLESSDLDEYVRCFGMHVGLKLLLPLLAPLKVGGVAAFLASGNLLCLVLLMLLPACRTAVTLWRMACRRRPAADYIDALLVGMFPVVGSLAYPVQMYSKHAELATFLFRDSAARLGRWVPIYGGKDSRLEIWAIKLTNLVVEALEIGLAATQPLRRWLSRPAATASTAARPIHSPAPLPTGRWDRLVNEQIRLIADNVLSELPPAVAAGDRLDRESGSLAA